MDKSDADPNDSIPSVDQSSNVSSLSDYKNEFLELKHLIDPNKYPKSNNNNNQFYENTIKSLQNELQQCKKKYNQTLQSNNERKSNGKIEMLIKQNQQLETNVRCANKQIQRLLDSFPLKTTNNLATKIILLEKENHVLNMNNSSLNDQITNYKRQIDELVLANDDYKRKYNDTNFELNTRISCVEELKRKISQQYSELQNSQKHNHNLTNSIDNLSNELEYLRKSEIWYKDQLHNCQNEKQKLSNELHELKHANIVNIEKIDHSHLELTKWQRKCDEIQLKSLKEKEEILHKFEILNHNSNDSGFINDQHDINYYETIIKELNDDIERVKIQMKQNNSDFEHVNKENSVLLTKCLLLQKYQQQKENEIEKFVNDEKLLKMKLSLSLDQQKSSQKQIDGMRSIITNLKIDLLKKNQENFVVEDSIKLIKEQFRVLKTDYKDLKNELDKQFKENLQLQNDKQQLFMSNNWKICELNQCRNVEKEIKGLQEKLLNLIQENNQIKHENLRLFNENSTLNTLLQDKDIKNIEQHNQNVSLSDLDNKNGMKLNLTEIIENLNNICELFEMNCKIDATTSGEFIRIFLGKLQQHCKNIVKERHDLKQALSRIDSIEIRCNQLKKKTDENSELLQTTNYQNSNEEVRRLQVLLEVKIREQNDQQKSYEKNYSLLLRKVKEHMKYRNSAEKHNGFLKEMNDSITNECNNLKTIIESKNYEIEQLKTSIYNYKQTTVNVAKEMNENQLEIVKKDLKQTEESLLQSKIHQNSVRNELKTNDAMNQALILENSPRLSEQTENVNHDEIINVQNPLNETASNENELTVKSDKENDKSMIHQLNDLKDRNNCLIDELKLLQSSLQQKSEELDELQSINQNSEKLYLDEANQLIFNLKIQIQTSYNDIDLLKNQKFVLQRLCNDLKIALRFHVNRCKVLQEKLMDFHRNKSEFNLISLPEIPVNSSKYNDEYIEKLLEKSQLLNKENYLVDVKQSLDGLRKEISLLQQQLQCT